MGIGDDIKNQLPGYSYLKNQEAGMGTQLIGAALSNMNHITVPPPYLLLQDKLQNTMIPSRIDFQFNPDNLTMDVKSMWATASGMNRAHPIVQFSHGDMERYKFSARLYALHSEDDIYERLEGLKYAVRRDDTLRRPPIWQFIWGKFISQKVVVETIGGVKYDLLRPDGSLRGVTLEMELLTYRTVDVILAEDEARKTDTFFTQVKTDDLWEDIAAREYNDPMLGDLLRRANPDLPFPGQQPGRIVKLPKLMNLRNQELEPQSVPLRRTKEELQLRAKTYAARSQPRESSVILR